MKYKFKSSDGTKTYTVTFKGGRLICDCAGFQYRNKCKHTTEVENAPDFQNDLEDHYHQLMHDDDEA